MHEEYEGKNGDDELVQDLNAVSGEMAKINLPPVDLGFFSLYIGMAASSDGLLYPIEQRACSTRSAPQSSLVGICI